MSGDDRENNMKQFLYVMPAVLICMLYALLAALAGPKYFWCFIYTQIEFRTGFLVFYSKGPANYHGHSVAEW